jgi:hypothetical protein
VEEDTGSQGDHNRSLERIGGQETRQAGRQ